MVMAMQIQAEHNAASSLYILKLVIPLSTECHKLLLLLLLNLVNNIVKVGVDVNLSSVSVAFWFEHA